MFEIKSNERNYRRQVSPERHMQHVGNAFEFLGAFSSFIATLPPFALDKLSVSKPQDDLLYGFGGSAGPMLFGCHAVGVGQTGAHAVFRYETLGLIAAYLGDSTKATDKDRVKVIREGLPAVGMLDWNASKDLPAWLILGDTGQKADILYFQFFSDKPESQEHLDTMAIVEQDKDSRIAQQLVANGNQILFQAVQENFWKRTRYFGRLHYLGCFESPRGSHHAYGENSAHSTHIGTRKTLLDILS